MHEERSLRQYGSLVVAHALLSAAAALAQTPEPPAPAASAAQPTAAAASAVVLAPAPAAASAPAVQAVTVTGVRQAMIERENRSASGFIDVPTQEKPRSIQTIEAGTLRQQIVQSEADVLRLIPGVGNTSDRSGAVLPSIRGQNAAVAVDGFASGITPNFRAAPELYETVEVLRGVSALESGTNFIGTFGGVINFLRKYPGRQRETEVFGSADRWGTWRLGVDHTQPLTGGSGLRLVAVTGRNDTHFRNENSHPYRVFGLSGTWRVNPDFVIDGALDYVREARANAQGLTPAAPTERLPTIDRRQSNGAPWSNYFTKDTVARVKASYVFTDDWALEASAREGRRTESFEDAQFSVFDPASGVGSQNTILAAYKLREWSVDAALKGQVQHGDFVHQLAVGASQSRTIDLQGASGGFFPDVQQTSIFNYVAPPRPNGPLVFEPAAPDAFQGDRAVFAQVRSSWRNTIDLWLGARRSEYVIGKGYTGDAEQRDRFVTPSVSIA